MTSSQFDYQFDYLLKVKKVLIDGLGLLGVHPTSFNLEEVLDLAFKAAEGNRPTCKIVNISDYSPKGNPDVHLW